LCCAATTVNLILLLLCCSNFDGMLIIVFCVVQLSERQMTFTTVNLILLVLCCLLVIRALATKPLHPDVQFLLDTMPRHPPPATIFPRRSSETALHSHYDQQALRRGGSATNLGEERERGESGGVRGWGDGREGQSERESG
jgi:hypothetical protein